MSDAPRSTKEAMAFLRRQHETGSRSWRAMCQSLQRQARGLPIVYPSARAAAVATPESERVYKIKDLRRGMVAFSDDPNDSNPFGHIYGIAGWKKGSDKSNPDDLLTWSNDVRVSGGVDLVPITFYRTHWGDGFQFGATWLNGYDFAEFNSAPVPTRGTLAENYQHAMEDLEKAVRYHRKAGHTALAKALDEDLSRMKKRWEKWGKKS